MRPQVYVRTQASPPASAAFPLASLRLSRSMAWPVGQAELLCSSAAEPPGAGESVVIEAAEGGGAARPLMTGRVLRRRRSVHEFRLIVEEATGALTRLRQDKAIRSGSAQKTMMELCADAGVEAEAEPPGALLPSAALLSNQSAMDHILRLARMSGMAAFTTADGKLRVMTPLPVPGGTVIRRQDGVLAYRFEDDPDEPAGGAVSGDGALGLRGPGAEAWVLQSLSGMTSGDGAPVLAMPGIKTNADVAKAAAAEAMRLAEGRLRRKLTIAGAPPADLGEVVLLAGFGSGDGPARVVAIEVLWSAETGLLATLDLNGIGGEG